MKRAHTKKYDHVLFDIDNTLTVLQPTLTLLAKKLGREPVTEEDIQTFQLSDAYDATPEEEKAFWKEYENELAVTAVIASDRVRHLLAAYTHPDTIIHVVTMRFPTEYAATQAWLKAHHFPYDHLVCLGKDSKVTYMEEHGIEAVFEDNPAFFEELETAAIAEHVDSFIIDYPYNRHNTATYRLDRQSGHVMVPSGAFIASGV